MASSFILSRFLNTVGFLLKFHTYKFMNILKYSVYILVTTSSHMQIKSYLNDNLENQELLTLDTISPIWAKRLEESKLLPLLSLERLRLYHTLSNCKLCSMIGWKFMFYFMIHSYSKLERTKKEFVKHWSENHHYYTYC